jgi:hypothetical protein
VAPTALARAAALNIEKFCFLLSFVDHAEALAQFYDRLIARLEAVLGVERAAAINSLPFSIYRCCNVGTVIEEFPPREGDLPDSFATSIKCRVRHPATQSAAA